MGQGRLTTDSRFRGRVLALWSVTFTGSTPIGGPIAGVVADGLAPGYGLGLGAVACLAATVIGALVQGRMPPADRYARRPPTLAGAPASRRTETGRDRLLPLAAVHGEASLPSGRAFAGCCGTEVPTRARGKHAPW